MKRFLPVAALAVLFFGAPRVPAVIPLGSGDPNFNATALNPPAGDLRNSGLQFQGVFGASEIGFGGTPISPTWIIAANHLGLPTPVQFRFRGVQYTATQGPQISGTDLRLWQIDGSAAPGPFPIWAPLYTRAASEIGREVVVFGHGTQRGAAYSLPAPAAGWGWGALDFVRRWGRNRIEQSIQDYGELLRCAFDGGSAGFGEFECHLSQGDSSGGMYVQEAGVWKLAGIHYAVDEYFADNTSTDPLYALTDARGLWEGAVNQRTQVTGANPVPSGFYSTRVSTYLAQILLAIGETSAAIDTYAKWGSAVFTPEQQADPLISGPTADPDQDGLANLAEYAFGTGPWRRTDAPAVGSITVLGSEYLTVTYTRAKLVTGVTILVEVSGDLQTWDSSPGSTLPVSSIDEGDVTRITVRDAVSKGPAMKRSIRVRVSAP